MCCTVRRRRLIGPVGRVGDVRGSGLCSDDEYGSMIYCDVKRTTIFLGDEDRAAIRAIQERYGVSTDSDAIRLALRVLAQAREIGLAPLPEARQEQESEG